MAIERTKNKDSAMVRWAVVIAIAAVAFFASYRFAVAQSPQPAAPVTATATTAAAGGTGRASGCCGGAGTSGAGSAGGCCGTGVAGPTTSTSATVSGGTQKVSVDVSKGHFSPNVIQLKAGVPAEITFGQGSGCISSVNSQQLGFSQDLTGGPGTVKLDGLSAGTYTFTCGMGMQSGTIIVK